MLGVLPLDDSVAHNCRARGDRSAPGAAEAAPARPEEERRGEPDDTDDEQDDTDRLKVHAGHRCADGPDQGGARGGQKKTDANTNLSYLRLIRK